MDFIRDKIMQILKTIKTIIVGLGKYLVLGLSYLMPRDKNIWIFGSYLGVFNDNAKYLFIYVNENCPEIRPIWISDSKKTVDFLRSKQFEAYYKYSLQGFFYALRGKLYIYNSYLSYISLWLRGGVTKINLWHGIPIKKIEFDIKKGKLKRIFNHSVFCKCKYSKHYVMPNFVLSTSKKVDQYFSSAFRVGEEKCLNFGYPRNEILSYSEDKIINFIERYESVEIKELVQSFKKYKKVFVYMPTWRDSRQDFIEDSQIDFELLNQIFQQKNYYLVIKLHCTTLSLLDLKEYKNILLLDNKLDMYPILPFTDCLITDYSSIFFDYKLMDKQVILFPFDKREYISKDREMYYDYSLVAENQLVVNSFSELIELIQSDVENKKDNTLLQEMIFETREIESCKKIVEFIKNNEK